VYYFGSMDILTICCSKVTLVNGHTFVTNNNQINVVVCIQKLGGKPEGKRPPGVDGEIILEWILRK